MELKDERAEGLERRETYSMLVETDAMVRTHRTLRRELCVSRMVIFILLISCTVFCAILYLQRVPDAKNNDMMNKDKAKETFATYKGTTQETSFVGFLKIKKPSESEKLNLTWMVYPKAFNNITLKDNNESLVIPRRGWYKLGLQITYTGKSEISLAHNITKFSDSYPQLIRILSVSDTVYKNSSWVKSIFSEVVHVFEKGDRVRVETQNGKLIDASWSKTFLTIQLASEIEDL